MSPGPDRPDRPGAAGRPARPSGPDAAALQRCIAAGGVAVFGADTVYGLACDPGNPSAVRRLYALKGRPPAKPSAVMFFDLSAAWEALPELEPRTREAMGRLMPGGVSVLLNNPRHRYPAACAGDLDTLGLRVPHVPALSVIRRPVLQSSANLAGAGDARRLADVPQSIRDGADLVLDAGELPGTASTVIDLRAYEDTGAWSIVRAGAVTEAVVRGALEGQFHFDPGSYMEMMCTEIPVYDEFQQAVAAQGDAAPAPVRRILELGTGTGETAARVLARRRGPAGVELVGIDESAAMLEAARTRLTDVSADGGVRVELRTARLQDPLPDGPFELVVSALAVHHLSGAEKRELFGRVREVLAPGGRFVLGDVIVPADPADQAIPLSPGYDRPDRLADVRAWLEQAGLTVSVAWKHRDLVVLSADA